MTLGWAIVNTDRHADTLVAPAIGLASDTHLVGVCSRKQARAEVFAAKHGAQVAYSSLETLLEDSRVDAVFIASPYFLHALYTHMAAQQGKHDPWSRSADKPPGNTHDHVPSRRRGSAEVVSPPVSHGVGHRLRGAYA